MAKAVRRPGDVGFSELKIRIAELDKLKAFVGWLESAKYKDNVPVAGVAAVHEFGSPRRNIPPRPFFRQAIEANQAEWMELLKNGAKSILEGKATAEQVMELLGLKASADVKNSIVRLDSPPLSAETVKRKGHADLLRDTGLMIGTITHEVTGGN